MKVVRLTSAQERAWRNRRAHWVDPKGKVLRAITPEEEAAIFPALQDARRVGETGTRTVTAVYKRAAPGGGVQKVEKPFVCRFDVKRTGPARSDCIVHVSVNGNRYMSGKDIILGELMQKHGSFILNHVNGKRLCVVRDPREKRSAFADSRSTPRPDNCVCREWIGTRVGKHHPSCEFNRFAPLEERAEGPDDQYVVERTLPQQSIPEPGVAAGQPVPSFPEGAPERQDRLPAPPAAHIAGALQVGVPQASVTPATMAIETVSPENCTQDCRGFQSKTAGWAYPRGKKPVDGQHHPLCKHYEDWLRHTQEQSLYVLYDAERQVALRRATTDEVTQAEVIQSRTGMLQVHLQGRTYEVIEAEYVDENGRLKQEPPSKERPESKKYVQPPPDALAASALGLPASSPRPDEPPEPAEPITRIPQSLDQVPPEGPPELPPVSGTTDPNHGLEPAPEPEPGPRLGAAVPVENPGPRLGAAVPVENTEPAVPVENTDESLRDERGLVGEQRDPGIMQTGHVVPVLSADNE